MANPLMLSYPDGKLKMLMQTPSSYHMQDFLYLLEHIGMFDYDRIWSSMFDFDQMMKNVHDPWTGRARNEHKVTNE